MREMRLGTYLFELEKETSLEKLASIIGVSVPQIYRIRQGKRRIHEKFIVGALVSFPQYTFEDMFYIKLVI